MDFIPVSTPALDPTDARAVSHAIEDGWISSEGPQVREFEERFAEHIGVKHAVAVANGTAALDIAFETLGIGPGDEVILPSFTIISCLNHILRSGATPVFIDALPDTWNLNPHDVDNAITPRTKAIVVAHIYGLPADIDTIAEIARKHNVSVIEDAAEAHGQQLSDRALGSYGTLSTFSFYSNKLITTGEGGMVLTDDDGLAARARELRNLSFTPERRFVHDTVGWNYRLTAMQAALGLSQLSRIDALLAHKREIGRHYQTLLGSVGDIVLPLPEYRGSENVYWVFGIVLPQDGQHTAAAIMSQLHDRGIGTRPFFFPLHKQPVLQKYGHATQPALPIAEWLGDFGFYLPNGADSTPEKRERVAEELVAILSR